MKKKYIKPQLSIVIDSPNQNQQDSDKQFFLVGGDDYDDGEGGIESGAYDEGDGLD